jgi:hypothetical protein
MIRFGSLVLAATLGSGLWACGGDGSTPENTPDSASPVPKDPLEFVPLDNEVPGWTVDQDHNKSPGQRAMTATTQTGVAGLIDGGFENYYQEPNIPQMFLWQNYVNATLAAAPEGAAVKLYIFEMPSAAEAKGIYTSILQRPSHSSRTGQPGDWEPTAPTIGTESRIQDTSSQWWINFYQDVFYIEVLLDPSFGPPPDYALGNAATKQEAVGFAQKVAAKI